jgi:FkbM family methyltransferase
VLGHHPFDCILDIGANEGQFAEIVRHIWPQAHVHSFEPLPDVHRALVTRFQGDAGVTAHNIGLSDRAGVQRMHQSAFSPSSSLLPMAELHRSEWPQSVEHTDVDVRLERLDEWSKSLERTPHSQLLIKIDVQGFELPVIDGGIDTLRKASVVVLEVSFYELYKGQPLFGCIHDRMTELGFIYRGNIEQFLAKDHTRVLYADAIFENTTSTEAHA